MMTKTMLSLVAMMAVVAGAEMVLAANTAHKPMHAAVAAKPVAAMTFEQYDANKDGMISREEFEKAGGKNFDALDADKDGNLSAEELNAGMAK